VTNETTFFRMDVSRNTGMVTLWMATEETPCGFKPVLGWATTEGVKEFAEMLLGMYRAAELKEDTAGGFLSASQDGGPLGSTLGMP